MAAKPAIQSVLHIVAVLDYLCNCDGEAGVTEISKATGVHKSTASRILSTLESRSLVSRNEWNSKYSLGMRLVEYARRKLDQIDVLSCARPYLERLVETTSETAHLALLDHHEIVYIDKVDTPQTLMMRSRVGNRAPAHSTALGKAMLADLSDEALDALFEERELPRLTSNTIADLNTLKEHLRRIGERGYALDDEENENGIRCAAAPIKDFSCRIIAAMSVSGPTVRVSRQRLEEIGRLVADSAAQLSQALGYRQE